MLYLILILFVDVILGFFGFGGGVAFCLSLYQHFLIDACCNSGGESESHLGGGGELDKDIRCIEMLFIQFYLLLLYAILLMFTLVP